MNVTASASTVSASSGWVRRSATLSAARCSASSAGARAPLLSYSSATLAPSPIPNTSRTSIMVRSSQGDEPPVVYNKEFGYSRKDVMIIGAAIFAAGYAMYYGLQATGMEPGYAGNWVQLIMIMGLCLGWVSTYIFRVATKQMTYVKQLEQYEDAVMRKRLEEMTDNELEEMVNEAEAEKAAKEAKRKQ